MTKYILHGGETTNESQDNKEFFFEMTKGLADPVHVLCLYFSREQDEWERLFQGDQKRFSDAAPTKVLEFALAERDKEIFQKQLQYADVIYLRGGQTDLLLKTLKPIENFRELIQGKVVSGSSAGACVLSAHFYTGTAGSQVRDGLGILQIKTFVHYREEELEKLQELESHGEILPIYKIPEEKFVILEE